MNKSIFYWFLVDAFSRPFSRKVLAYMLFNGFFILWLIRKKQQSVSLLMKAQRLHPNKVYTSICKRMLLVMESYYLSMMPDDVGCSVAVSRSIIIKFPDIIGNNISKGILIITFTDTNRYYYHNIDLQQLEKYFYIVLEPSWAGYCLPEILFWGGLEYPVLVQATEATDRDFLKEMGCQFIPLEFGASDWVNYHKFYPLESTKTYDSVYVANYTYIKRLHIYFKAIKKIKNMGVGYKAAIICASWGKHRETALKLIKFYGIEDFLDVHESLGTVKLNKILNQSKCNILLSLKEGSNRSLFESMFSNTPVIALKNNIGINKKYINKSTGLLIKENGLVNALLEIKSKYKEFSPREWALKNISPEVTTKKLLMIIESLDRSFTNTGDVLVKTNDPEVSYFNKNNHVDKNYYMNYVLNIFNVSEDFTSIDVRVSLVSEAFRKECNGC